MAVWIRLCQNELYIDTEPMARSAPVAQAVTFGFLGAAACAQAEEHCTSEISLDLPTWQQECAASYCDADPWLSWATIDSPVVFIYVVGVLWMFMALAVVCDEFFVPALEVLVRRWDIPPDIAGATFMAAGGSAPELFTSFIGTFTGSAVGFGTIVGSAVFNVLFVIGTCAVFSTETLELTWWPLARDATYYCASLATLAVFFGVVANKPPDTYTEIEVGAAGTKRSQCFLTADLLTVHATGSYANDTEAEVIARLQHMEIKCSDLTGCMDCAAIWWWEALILFLMYFGYCTVMKFNKQLAGMLDEKAAAVARATGKGKKQTDSSDNPVSEDASSTHRVDDNLTVPLMSKANGTHSINHRSSWRKGLWTTLMDDQSLAEQAELHLISHVPGSVDERFKRIDTNGNGTLCQGELKKVLVELRVAAGGDSASVTDQNVESMFEEIASKVASAYIFVAYDSCCVGLGLAID